MQKILILGGNGYIGSQLINDISQENKVIFVPLAWNFYKEIKERILNQRRNKNDIFVMYFPSYKEEK